MVRFQGVTAPNGLNAVVRRIWRDPPSKSSDEITRDKGLVQMLVERVTTEQRAVASV